MDVNLAISLLAGVLSSIVAVLIVELYRRGREKYDHRPIRELLDFTGSRCTIIAPAFPLESLSRSGLITIHDATAIAYTLEACSLIKCQAEVMASRRMDRDLAQNIVAIGGPWGNSVVAYFLRKYCGRFIIRNLEDFQSAYSECADQQFSDNEDTAYAFIIKLGPELTQLPGSVLLLWGHHGEGTSAAAYFLRQYPKTLSKLGKESFFVVISLNRALGYRSVSANVLDISDHAFSNA